jgi:hypothetical protein
MPTSAPGLASQGAEVGIPPAPAGGETDRRRE